MLLMKNFDKLFLSRNIAWHKNFGHEANYFVAEYVQ